LLDHSKWAKLQWLQNISQLNGDNLKTVRHETSRTFMNKERSVCRTKLMSFKRTVRIEISELCVEA